MIHGMPFLYSRDLGRDHPELCHSIHQHHQRYEKDYLVPSTKYFGSTVSTEKDDIPITSSITPGKYPEILPFYQHQHQHQHLTEPYKVFPPYSKHFSADNPRRHLTQPYIASPSECLVKSDDSCEAIKTSKASLATSDGQAKSRETSPSICLERRGSSPIICDGRLEASCAFPAPSPASFGDLITAALRKSEQTGEFVVLGYSCNPPSSPPSSFEELVRTTLRKSYETKDFVHLEMSSNLASVPEDASPTTTPTSATLSPATKEQRRERLDILHRKLRPPPFTHRWEFWFDGHQDASKGAPAYENRVKALHSVGDVKDFWDFVNNTPISILKIRDSIHLFKKTVKPVWEDPRNLKGGSWTFRVSKDKSEAFWNEVMMFAVGEALQEAVASQRGDDICGVTISNRFNSHLVQIWNRDGSNQKSIDAILAVVMEKISPELKPKPDSFYYKKHSEHRGYNESVAQAQPKTVVEARIEASPEAEEKAM